MKIVVKTQILDENMRFKIQYDKNNVLNLDTSSSSDHQNDPQTINMLENIVENGSDETQRQILP